VTTYLESVRKIGMKEILVKLTEVGVSFILTSVWVSNIMIIDKQYSTIFLCQLYCHTVTNHHVML